MNEEEKKEEKNFNKSEDKKTSKPGGPQKPNNSNKIVNLLTIVFAFLVIVMILFVAQRIETTNREDPELFSDLISNVRDGKVSRIEVSPDQKTLFVEIYKDSQNPNRDEVEVKEFPNVSVQKSATVVENINTALGGENALKIGTGEGEIEYFEQPKPWYTSLFENGNIWYFILIFSVIGVTFFFIRKISDTNNRAISFGNSRARVFDEMDDTDKITFKDVAGNEEAKQELIEVVDFLGRPEDYIKMGAKIPKGVLLIGSPGNGKTLLAKAVAGEAKVPFFYVSGSEFVEMFVGVGAGRVRDLFKKAKKKAPCVVFIDEIDAVGRQRGAGLGGGNDEREQTLNQILVEMDGFETTNSIILIGATNRPDVLDPALLRPGRFDRQVTVTAPDRKEREEILKVHSKNKKLAKDIDLTIIAKRTPGFSGADLMNVLNEAAILAVREKKKLIDNETLREAVEKVALGPALKSKIITEKQKKLTAYHEAGHALMASILPNAQKVQKITIIPRGRAAGYTFNVDDDNDAITRTKSEFLDDIKVLFGGYCTEEIVFGDISTGASNDLSKATETARNMVRKYGMSSLGPISFDEDRGMTFLGRDMAEKQNYSEEIAKQIDLEIEKIIRDCYQETKRLLTKFREYLDLISAELIEKEVLEYEDFNKIVKPIFVSRV
jgi:cell division protease FtsH